MPGTLHTGQMSIQGCVLIWNDSTMPPLPDGLLPSLSGPS